MIGIFFYVNGLLHVHKEPLDKAEDYGDFKTTPLAHDTLWENRLRAKQVKDVDFNFYPRGRVVYNRMSGQYIVYIDRDLNKPRILRKIAEVYNFADAVYRVELDEHYRCHMCCDEIVE